MTSNDFNKYGVPAQKKFPMPDADHVRSAIKFFNYVSPHYEKILARAILQRAKEYGVDLSEMSIGDENRFKKYLPESELKHHGIKGQKWGIRRFQNEDGSYTEEGKKRYGFGADSRISVKRGDKRSSIYYKIDDENELKVDMNDKQFREITETAERSTVALLNDLGLLKMSYEELLDVSEYMHPDDIEELNKYFDAYTDLAYTQLIEEYLKRH